MTAYLILAFVGGMLVGVVIGLFLRRTGDRPYLDIGPYGIHLFFEGKTARLKVDPDNWVSDWLKEEGD